jgi:hypothetical protein
MAALQRNIPVIPLLVRGASVPCENDLPAKLAQLSYRNGIAVRPDPDFHCDMESHRRSRRPFVPSRLKRVICGGESGRSAALVERRNRKRERQPLDQTAAIVCTSTRKASLTSRSTMRSVFGGYLPSGNIFGNSRNRNCMNFGMSCEWTRYVVN